MKPVLIIYPPFEGKGMLASRFPFPIGPLYLAAYLEDKGMKAKVMDFSYPPLRRKTERPDTLKGTGITRWNRFGWPNIRIRAWLKTCLMRYHDVIGVSSLMSTNYTGLYKMVDLIKEVSPESTVVVGGPHATADPEHVFKHTEADYICIGEGEEAFHELLKGGEHEAIIGRKDKIIDSRQAFFKKMDDLPFPNRDLLLDNREVKQIYVTFSRGCPHKCSFCGSHKIQGRRWRHKSPDRAVDELRHYIEKWGVKNFIVEDDNATPGTKGIEWMKDLCSQIIIGLPKIKLHISHGIPVYATADKELCILMWKAGFKQMVFPLESTHLPTLKHMQKEDTFKFWKRAIRNWSFEKYHPTEIIIGYPFVETIETMLTTLIQVAKKDSLSWASHFRLNKDTKLFEQCIKAKYIKPDYDTLKASTFCVETERFNLNDLREISRIARGFNFAVERGFNPIMDDPMSFEKSMKLTLGKKYQDYPKIGDEVATGSFKFSRSQTVFTAIMMARMFPVKGKPKIRINRKKDALTYEGIEKSRVFFLLSKLLREEGKWSK